VLVVVLEAAPMLRFIRWRVELRKGGSADTRGLGLLTRINDLQVALVVVMTFVAAAMARGLWMLP